MSKVYSYIVSFEFTQPSPCALAYRIREGETERSFATRTKKTVNLIRFGAGHHVFSYSLLPWSTP